MSCVSPVTEKLRPFALRLAGPAIAAVPETVSGTDKGEFAAFDTIDKDALRAPSAEGVAVTWIVQVAYGASDAPQVFVSEKSAALTPTTLIPLKETAVVPLFASVTVCRADENPTAVFAKLTLDGLACNAGDPSCGINATWKSDGATLSWGWNGAEGDTRPNSDAVLSEGLFARFSNAESVSVGGVVFAGVVKARS